jgi:hypothetical protein
METLIENKPLLYSVIGSAGAVFVLASGLIPELSASLQIETFNEEVKKSFNVVISFYSAYLASGVCRLYNTFT